LGPRGAVSVGGLIGARGDPDGAGEPVELGELVLELELELRGVDALGLGDEDAPPHELDLEPPEAIVGGAQLVALALELIALASNFDESCFERRDLRCSIGVVLVEESAPSNARTDNHGRSACRYFSIEKDQWTIERRFFGAGCSTSTPSSSASSARSSIATLVARASSGLGQFERRAVETFVEHGHSRAVEENDLQRRAVPAPQRR